MKQALRIFIVCGVLVSLWVFAASISDTRLMEAVELTNMYRDQISLGVAFVGGFLLVLSPCALPLFLMFFIETVAEIRLREKGQGVTRAARLLFLAGFFFVLLALGFSVSALGQFLIVYREIIVVVAGLMLIWFGAVLVGGLTFASIPLSSPVRSGLILAHPAAYVLLGAGSAVGIGICSTPILFSIFALAAGSADIARAFLLLTAFSLGLFTPFILLVTNYKLHAILFQKKYARGMEIGSGALLVGIGFLYVTENSAAYLTRDIFGLSRLSYYVQAYLLAIPFLPGILTAVFLGGVFIWSLRYERIRRILKRKCD